MGGTWSDPEVSARSIVSELASSGRIVFYPTAPYNLLVAVLNSGAPLPCVRNHRVPVDVRR